MADPLSVAASVVVVSKARHAPKECKNLKMDVDTIQTILSQLQLFLLGNNRAPRSRTSLILVDQVIAILAACVTTFSELDTFEGDVKNMLTRLESHKSSLNLMLMILTCQKQEEAEDKVDILCELVQQVLESSAILNQRLAATEPTLASTGQSDLSRNSLDEVSDSAIEDSGIAGITRTGTWTRHKRGFAFEELLNSSRVYKNASKDNSDAFSIVTSAGRTASWSILSGLSLSETSHIGILAIPIYETDIANKEAYDFNPPVVEPVAVNVQTKVEPGVSKTPRREWLKGLVRGDRSRQRKFELAQTGPEPLPPGRIFGLPLSESIEYSNVEICLWYDTIDSDIPEKVVYGHIPLVVAKSGVFLKNSGIGVEEIFAYPGNPSRLLHLQNIFDTPPYGRPFKWDGYTVHDAAALLLRFIKTIPQPIIPYDMYDLFIKTCGVLAAAHELSAVLGVGRDFDRVKLETLQLTRTLPPPNRHLLAYLLDLLQFFGQKSYINKMTVARLTAAFQPAILSRPPAEMDADAHAVAARVVTFLIDFNDDFVLWETADENH
ncbi:Rho GTPase activation protein [Xylariaceae sp. FL1019]|nr:Rho GTPase activation protein [Xylariaceae sp. FL1019]